MSNVAISFNNKNTPNFTSSHTLKLCLFLCFMLNPIFQKEHCNSIGTKAPLRMMVKLTPTHLPIAQRSFGRFHQLCLRERDEKLFLVNGIWKMADKCGKIPHFYLAKFCTALKWQNFGEIEQIIFDKRCLRVNFLLVATCVSRIVAFIIKNMIWWFYLHV